MKYVLSAVGGAVTMFQARLCVATFTDREKLENTHYDVSAIEQPTAFSAVTVPVH